MGALDVEERPTNVEPTETKTRRTRSDAGKPRGPKLTPGQLRAKADELEKAQRAKSIERVNELLHRAYELCRKAEAELRGAGMDQAAACLAAAEMIDGIELGSPTT